MKELTDQEHDELVNAKFTVISFRGFHTEQPDRIPGRLVEIDSHLGATVINRDNTDEYLWCIRGPGAHKASAEEWAKHPGAFDEIFQWLVDSIKSGILDLTDHSISIKTGVPEGGRPSSDFCIFNQ